MKSVVFYNIAEESHFPLAVKMAHAAFQRKKRLVIKVSKDKVEALDDHLWNHEARAFLPHETWTPGKELEDPEAFVVLVTEDASPFDAPVLLQLEPASFAFATQFETVLDIVQEGSPEQKDASRKRYLAWRQHHGTPPMLREKV